MAIVVDKIQTSGSRQNVYELVKNHVPRFAFDRSQSLFITNKTKPIDQLTLLYTYCMFSTRGNYIYILLLTQDNGNHFVMSHLKSCRCYHSEFIRNS